MDNKDNNGLIDFSNQPLGIMAQEGAQIEDQLNKEYEENEAKRKEQSNPAVLSQDNPFANILPPSNDPAPSDSTFINNSLANNTPSKSIELNSGSPQEVAIPHVESTPVSNEVQLPTPGIIVDKKDDEANIRAAEQTRKEQIMNELMSGGKKEESVHEKDQTPSWGIFVFLILVGFVVAAVVLFKTGKIDSFFNKDEETKESVPEKQNETGNQESPKPEGENPVPQQAESIKIYHLKETIYLAAGDTITVTYDGDIDVEKNIGVFTMNVNYKGVLTRNVKVYNDYINDYSYSYIDFNKSLTPGWYYEKIEHSNLSLEGTLDYLHSLGDSQEVSKDNYKIIVSKQDAKKIVNSNSEYIDFDKIKDGDITVEYSLENGIVKRIRIDLSNFTSDFNKFIIQQDFSEYNKAKEVSIPEEAIKNAKKI